MAYKVFRDDKELARKIGERASKLIERAYSEKPLFWCGKSMRVMLSGLFYILAISYDSPVYRRELAVPLDVSIMSITISHQRWLKTFPSFFSNVEWFTTKKSFGSPLDEQREV